jgi:hypothetical protein
VWYAIGSIALAAYRVVPAQRRLLVLGLMGSMLVIFIEGLVYQNLEVKQVNAYFWTLAGLLAFLAARPE